MGDAHHRDPENRPGYKGMQQLQMTAEDVFEKAVGWKINQVRGLLLAGKEIMFVWQGNHPSYTANCILCSIRRRAGR